ncbi:MAG TPA: glycoside hydrolase family 43 protein, partial [Tepidisphaeraceae bacterium]|nr:glycoside hydrolase family 43 protein [Tepidisphaeraceae bacterium]
MKSHLVLLVMVFPCAASTAAAEGGFLFSTFRDDPTPASEQIYFGISPDGRHWDALAGGRPVLVSDVGEQGARDSFLLRAHDSQKVWLIATDLCIARNRSWHRATHSGSRSIVVWETDDLVHWSPARLVQVAPDDAGCAWAPEAIYDPETRDYLVYWASFTGRDMFARNRIWAARTKDFRTFEKPFIYLERREHVVDIHIMRDGDTFYRFTKDDKVKTISMAKSQRLMGPWEDIPQFTAGQGNDSEGPICYRLPPTAGDGQPPEWCVLLDNLGARIGPGKRCYEP